MQCDAYCLVQGGEAMKLKNLLAMSVFAGLTAGASAVGARVARRPTTKTWYRLLRKPRRTPPDWVFGAVWPGLYGLIAYSGYRAWRKRQHPGGRTALALWGMQLGLNAAWTPLFFGRHRSRAALADLGATIATVLAYMARVRNIDRPAAAVMTPYLAWLGFASTLNGSIVRRNPPLLAG
jgi:benzodiazapine receptor